MNRKHYGTPKIIIHIYLFLIYLLLSNAVTLQKQKDPKQTPGRSKETFYEYDYNDKMYQSSKEPIFPNYEDDMWAARLAVLKSMLTQPEELPRNMNSQIGASKVLVSYLNQLPSQFFSQHHKDEQQSKEDVDFKSKKIDPGVMGLSVKSVNKRGGCCGNSRSTMCSPCSTLSIDGKKVTRNYMEWYTAMPLAMINLTGHLPSQTEQCSNLQVETFPADLNTLPNLFPEWIKHSKVLGKCPSTLTRRHLGNRVFPSHVVELLCLCKDGLCSSRGGEFLCTEVTHPITIWHIDSNKKNRYAQDVAYVTVGCICAQKPSQNAGNFNARYIT